MEEKFKKEFNCTNVPKQVLDFYATYGEQGLPSKWVFSFDEAVKMYNGFFKTFLSLDIKHDETAQYIPFASDGQGGYYAFIGNREDENLYYLDHEFPDDDPVIYTVDEILSLWGDDDEEE